MTAADVFTYGSILWGIAEATYNWFFKRTAGAVSPQ